MSDTLEIRNGHLQYGKTVIASNMSAAFLKPEIVSIIGPNGSGKSTLLKALGRLLKPTGGAVAWNHGPGYPDSLRCPPKPHQC